jgi:hypothetical protein
MNERMSLDNSNYPEPTDTVMTLSLAEVRAMWRVMKHESINPNEHPLFRSLTHKIVKLLEHYGE